MEMLAVVILVALVTVPVGGFLVCMYLYNSGALGREHLARSSNGTVVFPTKRNSFYERAGQEIDEMGSYVRRFLTIALLVVVSLGLLIALFLNSLPK